MKRFASLLFSVALLGATIFAWVQRQAIYDWTRLRNYEPPGAIVQLATDTTMTDAGRHLFYVNHPELSTREQFNHYCTHVGEQTIVLGCYIRNDGIYLFDIDDPRLMGVEQVTAAHEMLHAAYDRLPRDERERIDRLTDQTFTHLSDERIKTTIESYRKRDPNIVPDELHSIIATEVRDIPSELEHYYKKYFANRAAVVAFSERYEGVLTERRNRVATLAVEIAGLRQEIEQLDRTLSEQRTDLERDRSSVRSRDEAIAFNERVDAYNNHIQNLNELIAKHNALVKEHNANILEQKELINALDSRQKL